MKNVMVANTQKGKRYNQDAINTVLKAQIENSIEVGWEPEDILVVANFDFEHMGVKTLSTKLNKKCLTGSKLYGLKWLFDTGVDDDVLWAHDLDAWQNVWFDPPEFKEVGISTYSQPHKLNGGSVFWRSSAGGVLDCILSEIEKGEAREEPTLNKLLKSPEHVEDVTVLNATYNVGCSGFVKRMSMAEKPVRVCHFNPLNRVAWDMHAMNRDGADVRSVGYRLEKLLRRHYTLAEQRM